MKQIPEFVRVALLAMAKNCMKQKPDQVLHDDGSVYMYRWHLEKSKETGSVYLHCIIRSDEDVELHDHPGDNMSIILDGEMIEETETGLTILKAGDIALRDATYRHRLILEKPVITLWIMGERTRDWGFWLKSGTFVPWQEFTKNKA